MIYIWVDDFRPAPVHSHWARTYDEAIWAIENCRARHENFSLNLDHDLGEEKNGYDICKYLVENSIPVVGGIAIHSMNPVGVANMRQLLTHYGYSIW